MLVLSEKYDIEEVWWNFEDQLKPSKCQFFRQVMDIYTEDESILRIDFEEQDLFGIQIFGKNFFNNEIPFVYSKQLIMNIGNLENWPNTPEQTKHVKLELRYGQPNPDFKFSKLKFWHGYKGPIIIDWRIRPEFTITVPAGMEIPDSGRNLKIWVERETEERGVRCYLKYRKPVITKKDGKRVYTYAMTENSYEFLEKFFSETPKGGLEGSYDVHNDWKFFSLPVFSAILGLVSAYTVITSYNSYLNYIHESQFNIELIIVVLSLIGLTLTLHKEDYEIPLNTFLNISIVVTVIGIVLSPLVEIWGPTVPLFWLTFTKIIPIILYLH